MCTCDCAQYLAQTALNAIRDIFNRFPAKGNPEIQLTLWQQLERLHREIPDKMIYSLQDVDLAAAIRAMRQVHDNGSRRRKELIELYNLAQD